MKNTDNIKFPKLLIWGGLAVAVGAYFITGALHNRANKDGSNGAASHSEGAPKVQVQRFQAQLRDNNIYLSGETAPSQLVSVKSRVQGHIDAIPCKEGDVVEEQQILATLAEEDRQAQVEEANALLAQRQLALKVAQSLEKKSLGSQTDVATAYAGVEEAQTKKTQSQNNLAYTKIKAPFKGVVNKIETEIGDFVDTNTSLMELAALDPLDVAVYVSESDIRKISPDLVATIKFLDGSERKAKLETLSMLSDPKTRSYKVCVRFDNPGYAIGSGRTAEVTLTVGQHLVHVIPSSALHLQDDGQIGIKCVDDNNRVVFYPVKVIDLQPEGAQIAGAPEQINLIVVGQESVVDGSEVQPISVKDKDD